MGSIANLKGEQPNSGVEFIEEKTQKKNKGKTQESKQAVVEFGGKVQRKEKEEALDSFKFSKKH